MTITEKEFLLSLKDCSIVIIHEEIFEEEDGSQSTLYEVYITTKFVNIAFFGISKAAHKGLIKICKINPNVKFFYKNGLSVLRKDRDAIHDLSDHFHDALIDFIEKISISAP